MTHRRRPRREAGAFDALGRAIGTGSVPASILDHFRRVREAVCRRICPDLLFNSDLSRELDRYIDGYEAACIEIEQLRSRLREESTHKCGAADA